MFRSLKHRNFQLFFYGQFVSLCGSWMHQTAQAWLVYRLTKDPLHLGLVAMASQFPVFVFGFHSGVLVDRFDHLRLVRATQVLAMAQAVGLAVLARGDVQAWHVFALALALGLVNAVDMPARQVLIGELVPIEDRHNAIALNSTIVNASRIVGPAIAGLLIGRIGESGCFALNAASFVSVIWALSRIELPRRAVAPSSRSSWQEIGDGLSYAVSREPIRAVLFLLTAFSLAGLPIYVLLPVFAEDILSSGARGLGLLGSFSGLGATVGALTLARRGDSKGLGRVVLTSLVVFGTGLGAMAFCRSLPLACALMWLIGWAAIQVLAGINTLLQELASDSFRGRVMSFYAMIFIGLSPLGSFLVGGLASRAGTTWTVLAEAAATLLAAAYYWKRLPAALREEEHLKPPPKPSPLPSPL